MKVLFIMLLVVLLVAIAAPVFADPADPVDKSEGKAAWGQAHKNIEDFDKVSDGVHYLQEVAAEEFETNLGQLIKNEVKPSL